MERIDISDNIEVLEAIREAAETGERLKEEGLKLFNQKENLDKEIKKNIEESKKTAEKQWQIIRKNYPEYNAKSLEINGNELIIKDKIIKDNPKTDPFESIMKLIMEALDDM